MKVRQGFVSNSSSSSFLIDSFYNYTVDEVKNFVHDEMKKYYKKHKDHYYNRYIDENPQYLDEWISVVDLESNQDILDSYDYWYSKMDLNHSSILITDHCDNFIPEDVAKKIVKKFNIEERRYWLHMG